jgi:hypothetical protein
MKPDQINKKKEKKREKKHKMHNSNIPDSTGCNQQRLQGC